MSQARWSRAQRWLLRARGASGRRTRLGAVLLLAAAGIAASLGVGRHVPSAAGWRSEFRPVAGLTHGVEGSTHYCDGCRPPLRYQGGPVIGHGLTVRPIYWQPARGNHPFPSGYSSIIDQYLVNVAAADRTQTNVFSIDTEYYERSGRRHVSIDGQIGAGGAYVDTDPLPRTGCRVSSDTTNGKLSACISDGQLTTELERFLSRRHLPAGSGNFYPVFFPPGVETSDGDGGYSGSEYCGYHSYSSTSPVLLYSNEPYIVDCGGGEAPSGLLAADTAIDTLSHEMNETITDPLVSAWTDRTGAEIGDICAEDYGEPLGSTDPAHPEASEYNQVINGGRYYTQTEFSNYAWSRFGQGYGCQHSEDGARTRSVQAGPPLVLDERLTRTQLPADGHSTSGVDLDVIAAGSPGSGQRVVFTVRALSGSGTCGALRERLLSINRYGLARTTYVASRSNMACEVTATYALSGQSVSAIIYQGSAAAAAPAASSTVPRTVHAGRPVTFTTTFVNRSARPIPAAQVALEAVRHGPHAPALSARQLDLAYSLNGRTFQPSYVVGSTAGGGSIHGVIAEDGFTVRAHRSVTVTIRLTLHRSVPRRVRGPLLSLTAYLLQTNPATEATAALGATRTAAVTVR